MLSEENEDIEQAVSNILSGIDIDSSALILNKSIMDNYIITKGRVNVLRIATRQILNFIEEYKNKGYLDVVREKVKANEEITKLQKENKEKEKQIDLSAEFIKNNMSEKKIINEICIKGKCNNEECHEDDLKECIKLHFEKLAKEKGE